MDIISWIKTTLSKYSSNNTHDKNAIYFVKNEDGKTGKIISDEVVYGNGGGANGVVVESPNQPTGGESVWVNPDEDTEEVEVYSRQQTDAMLNTKQNELTLTVKDNGNIVIANIQGQTKEFMPATPSGDPMHYAYVAAGAEYNDTGADIIKTAPWADLADDDADKTVIHKAGYWYLNGLGDITIAQMRGIYNTTINFGISPYMEETFRSASIRTNFFLFHREGYQMSSIYATFNNAKIEAAKVCSDKSNYFFAKNIAYMAYDNKVTRHFIGVLNLSNITNTTMAFNNCTLLKTIKLKKLKVSISFPNASMLSCKSILYMIENEVSTATITITLHADAYARAMANADIVAALEAHPNVSLASA